MRVTAQVIWRAIVGQKKAREIWYLCRQYNAQQALEMGLVNKVVPVDQVEDEAMRWAQEILEKSPIAIRFLKAGFNADLDGADRLASAGGRRHHAVLHERRRQRRQEGVFGKTQAQFQKISPPTVER